MKKFYSLMFAAVMAVPAMMAETVTINLYGQVGNTTATFAPDYANGILGKMDCEMTRNADGSFTITNFAGVNKANLTFSIDKNIKGTDMQLVITGPGDEDFEWISQEMTPARYGFVVKYPDNPTEPAYVNGELNMKPEEFPTIDDYTSVIRRANDAGTQMGFQLIYTANDLGSDIYGTPNIEVLTTDDRRKTGTFVGEESDYILVSPSLFCLDSSKDNSKNTGVAARSYFSENEGKYTVILQGNAPAYYEKIGEEWPETPNAGVGGQGFPFFVVFDIPESAGIDEIAADENNAPVEYYNLQGVRVENPENGLYIRRQGSKVEKVVIR